MFKEYATIFLTLMLFPLFGCGPMMMSSALGTAMSLAPAVYFSIPGNLKIEPEKEDPLTTYGKHAKVRTVAVNGEDAYDAIDQSGIFEKTDFYGVTPPHSRREAGQYAKDNGLDAFLIVDENLEGRRTGFSSSQIGGLRAKIVDVDGKVLYDQAISAQHKQGLWGESPSGEEIEKSSIQGLLNDLEKHFM